jgi:predicted RNA-binding protein associated with RNAse of E/G family
MKNSLYQHIHIAFHLMVLALVLTLGAFIAHQKEKAVVSALTERIHTQEVYMYELQEITDRNAADDSAAGIIQDCPRRTEYESYLVRLGVLSKQELVIMQNLFEGCGTFFPEQKAYMVAKLDREFKAYLEYIDVLAEVTDTTEITKHKKAFEDIIALERERSQLLADQSVLQGKIISLLISGKSAQGQEVSALLVEAQAIADLLTVHDQRIDTLRQSITL